MKYKNLWKELFDIGIIHNFIQNTNEFNFNLVHFAFYVMRGVPDTVYRAPLANRVIIAPC